MRPGLFLNEASAPLATGEAISPSAHATWRSPVPYLFGGIAAMLGLITFALLILVCSYWKLSGYVESVERGEQMSERANFGEGGNSSLNVTEEKRATDLDERFVVIMAGDERKIFLAQPIRCRASCLTGGGGQEAVKPDEAVDVLAGGETQGHV